MWSEMADRTTLESRVWPRAAAVAEKLWSPRSLTDAADDMYRRIVVLDDRLDARGLRHRRYREPLLREMAPEQYLQPLRTLISVLEEDKFFNRMALYDPMLYTTTPLDRVMDAAPPESYLAYTFGRDVESWLATRDDGTRMRLVRTLESWVPNYEQLAPAFAVSQRVKEVEPHSAHLSELAALALEALRAQGDPVGQDSTHAALFDAAAKAYGGTILAVAGPLQQLVTASGRQ